MGIVAKFIPLVIVSLLVFTEPGQRVWRAGVDWASEHAEDWTGDRIEEQQERQKLRERLQAVEPACDSNFTPDGFEVSEGQAIALAMGDRKVDCDLLDTEPLGGRVDRPVWHVHVDAEKVGGCDFSAKVDGETAEVFDRYGGCESAVLLTQVKGADPHDAGITGFLRYEAPCFQVVTLNTPWSDRQTFTPIWPEGFSYRGVPFDAVILDEGHNVVTRVGEKIRASGMGTTDASIAESSVKDASLVERCPGPYWLMGLIERKG